MTESIQAQIEKLRASIEGLEAQRGSLGDEIVKPALEALRQQLAALAEQASPQAPPLEERRMVTILFMDMVGSTSMAEKMDPEEWRQVVARLHHALGQAINAHHGTVAQYLGDGILAFFGAKYASEEDPENAIRAALEGQSAVVDLIASEKVQLRAGIHTGLVVVGDLGEPAHKEFTASGDAVNVAARLQSAAPAGGTLISHDTYRYVRGVFDVIPRPPLMVKGKSEPLQTYLVRRAKARPFRSVTRGVAGVETRTVGREEEMQALQDAYLRAYEEHGLVWAQLVSEPGVGKSRLLADMNDWLELREETIRLLRARAFPDDANQPFALVRRMWFDRFQIADDTPLEQAQSRWVEHFREFSGIAECEEQAHALGLLVGLPFHSSPYIGAMRNDPIQVKGRALVVSREVFKAVRQAYPVVVMLEDMQWMDSASREYLMEVFLGETGDEEPNGLLILGAARTEWQPPSELERLFKTSLPNETEEKVPAKWGVQVNLAPLSNQATRELAREIFQRAENIPESILDLLVQRSEGVPYFTEEIVNWFIDRGILDTTSEPWHFFPEKLRDEPLPATLQHLLLTRLGSLTQPERAALQRGAIFGRHFWTGGVEALGVPAGAATLGPLQPRGFVEAQTESAFQGDTEWSFRHNLLKEVTYETVLKRERAALHKVAARWLEGQARAAGRLEEFAGLLGEHCERAGELNAATDWYLLAGKRAMGQGAPHEAKSFYTQALELLPPVDRERRWQALLGREEALSVLGDAELCRADLASLLELAQAAGDDNYLAEANYRQAVFGLRLGNKSITDQASREALAAARRCGNEAIEAKSLAITALMDLYQGDRSTAIEKTENAIRLARTLGDESVLAYVLYRAAFTYGEFGEFERSYRLYEEQIELDHRLGNRSQEAIALGNIGAALIGTGHYKQARTLIEQASQIGRALGARRSLAYNLVNLGDIYRATGDLRRAYQLTEEALRENAPTQDARSKVGILEQLGIILMQMGDNPTAFRFLSEAFELAGNQNLAAMSCEIETSLAACAVSQGHLDQAQEYIQHAWGYLKENGWVGMNSPGRVYLNCAETFDALGDVENVLAVLSTSRQAFMEVADKINEPSRRQSFLENVPEHRALTELWDRMRLTPSKE